MRYRISLLFFMVALLAPLLASPFSTAQAQSGGWTAPQLVSDPAHSSWFPDIAVAPDNSVHMVWASGMTKVANPKAEDGIDLLMYRALRDGKWSEINNIANPGTGGYATRNSLVAGRDNELHLLIRSQLRVDYLHAPEKDALSFQAWSKARKISNLTTPYYGTLGMDSKGVLHALWNEGVGIPTLDDSSPCPGCTDVFYRRSDNDGVTWSEPVNISQMPEGSVKPQIKIDAQDNLHVVWEEGYDTLTGRGTPTAGVYRRSRDGGQTWDPPVRFVLPSLTIEAPTPVASDGSPAPTPTVLPDAPKQMAIGLYQNTEPIVVFRAAATNRMYYATSKNNGSEWASAIPFEQVQARALNDTPWDDYWMATDGQGNVHLVLSGLLANDTSEKPIPRVIHMVWNGQSWSEPEVVDTEQTYPAENRVYHDKDKNKDVPVNLYPEWPRIAIGDGNTLHVAWFTRDTNDLYNSDNAHYRVWYSTKKLDIPASVPLPTFTPAPTVATPVPTALPTVAPIPTLTKPAALAPQLSDPKEWERPGMGLIGLAAVPVLGFLGAFVIVGLVIRRR